MNQRRAANVLRVHAVVTLALGALLVADSWDGLYEWLALPQALPALLVQLGGAFVVAFGYLLWRAAAAPGELRRTVAIAAAGANGAAAVIIALWLIIRGKADLAVTTEGIVDTKGIVELVVAAVVLGAFAVAEALVARHAGDR
ncbi:MAG: hypothetical protein ACJ76M_12660 [Solirubrobacteraceae bacterium]